jgi:hypothetical protein
MRAKRFGVDYVTKLGSKEAGEGNSDCGLEVGRLLKACVAWVIPKFVGKGLETRVRV